MKTLDHFRGHAKVLVRMMPDAPHPEDRDEFVAEALHAAYELGFREGGEGQEQAARINWRGALTDTLSAMAGEDDHKDKGDES